MANPRSGSLPILMRRVVMRRVVMKRSSRVGRHEQRDRIRYLSCVPMLHGRQ